jgi:hypothetical protein
MIDTPLGPSASLSSVGLTGHNTSHQSRLASRKVKLACMTVVRGASNVYTVALSGLHVYIHCGFCLNDNLCFRVSRLTFLPLSGLRSDVVGGVDSALLSSDPCVFPDHSD